MTSRTVAVASVIALGLGVAITAPVALGQSATATSPAAAPPTTVTAPKLHQAMRTLWRGHLVATRDYALAVHAGNKADEKKAIDAVVANARAISDVVAGFHGKETGAALFKFLGGHWGGVKELTDAAKARTAAAEDKAVNELAANAGEIAKFLAGVNPNWREADLRSALTAHVGHHAMQVDMMMSDAPKPGQDGAWVRMHRNVDAIAATLAEGIAKQFPDKVN